MREGRARKWSERISDKGAHLAGEPFAQFVALVASGVWLAAGGSLAGLSVALSIVAITLTQMVLNQQRRHEAALHLKIDELVKADTGARSELAGIETKSEAELKALQAGESGGSAAEPELS